MIRVAIADDHPIVRQGLRRIASEGARIVVTGEAATARELFRLVAGTPVDVVLLDVSMPGSAFVETVHELREKFPGVRLLVLSVHPEDQWALRALRAGASGYLTKDHSPEQPSTAWHAAASTSARPSPGSSLDWWTSARTLFHMNS
jgi:DNA-binding NarL/FixJ family response regulator